MNIKDELKPGQVKLWCACGLSKKQPWCDGEFLSFKKIASINLSNTIIARFRRDFCRKVVSKFQNRAFIWRRRFLVLQSGEWTA